MNQNKDYDNKINEDELGPLKLKISPRRGLIVIGIIFIIILIIGMFVLIFYYEVNHYLESFFQ
mgnify:CR=1 FL=1